MAPQRDDSAKDNCGATWRGEMQWPMGCAHLGEGLNLGDAAADELWKEGVDGGRRALQRAVSEMPA